MNTKRIPSLITLLGCLVAAIASYVNHYTLQKMLVTILWVLIVFYILGFTAKVLFDKYIPPIEPESDILDEGSVIEKMSDGEYGEDVTESEDEAADFSSDGTVIAEDENSDEDTG